VFLDESIALLERTPRVVHELLLGLPETWLGTADTEGGWTSRDVIGHLISGEVDDWIPRAEIIVAEGPSRPFTSFDRFAHVTRDRDVPLHALIDRFSDLRADNLGRLRELVDDDTDLDLPGTHPDFGAVTLRELIAAWAVHDLDHLAQVQAALAASRDAAVGPWKASLGILLRREAAGSGG